MEKTMGLSSSFSSGLIVNSVNINEFVENMFIQADKDQNGNISFDEFKKFLIEHQENKDNWNNKTNSIKNFDLLAQKKNLEKKYINFLIQDRKNEIYNSP
jgi:hypothetical protein